MREEWACKLGLTQFSPGSVEFDKSIRFVLDRIGAKTDGVVHNRCKSKLIEGAKALQHPWRVAAQNLADSGKSSASGWTCFGDRAVNKQGVLATFLAVANDPFSLKVSARWPS